MCFKKPKKIKIFKTDFRGSNSVNNFNLLKNSFDRPVAHERPYDSICSYPEGFKMIIPGNDFINLNATKNWGVILGTKDCTTFKPPFTVSTICRWSPAEFALYCPAWIHPVNDMGGRRVKEYDLVEGSRDYVVFTAHDLPDNARIVFDQEDQELFGYNHPDKKAYPRYSMTINPQRWMEYKMQVTIKGITWWGREEGKKSWYKFHKLKLTVPEIEFYLRVSIIMRESSRGDGPSIPASMDLKLIEITKP